MDAPRPKKQYRGAFPLPDYLQDEEPFVVPDLPDSKFEDEVPITIIQRSAWGARDPLSQVPMSFPIQKVKFTGEDVYKYDEYLTKALQKMQNLHMDDLKEPDVPFNFLVDEGGLIFEGRGWKTAPKRGNDVLEIAFLGNYADKYEGPSFNKCDAAHSLIMQGVRQNLVHPQFSIDSLKKKEDYSQHELDYYPNHDDDFIPVDPPYGN